MNSEQVLAVPTEKLWSILEYTSKGVISDVNNDTIQNILSHSIFQRRDLLEYDSSYKQIIPYAVITFKDEFFLFHRLNKQTEKRLHNLYSLGVGGHMNPYSNSVGIDYLHHELERELNEEVQLKDGCDVKLMRVIGYINDDLNDVGKVHLGVLYEIQVTSKDIEIKEKNKMSGGWVTKGELINNYQQMETWSKIYIDLIK